MLTETETEANLQAALSRAANHQPQTDDLRKLWPLWDQPGYALSEIGALIDQGDDE